MSGRFGVRSLRRRFPTDDACLEYIFRKRHERHCSCGGVFKRIKGRQQYHCSRCSFQVAPLAGTIFEKSRVPLTLWFHAIMMFSNAKSGLAAKTIQRDLEITYKCAWRMARLIRSTLRQSDEVLKGTVELDLAYFGGKGEAGKNNERLSDVFKAKTKVLAAIERKKRARAQVVSSGSAENHKNFLWQNVSTKGTKLMTDKTLHLDNAAKPYNRHSVHHKKQEYVRGDVHTRPSIGSGRTRKDRSGEPTNLFLRSICSPTSTALSFITTTQARTRSGFLLCSIPYCSIEQSEEAPLFVHHSILPRLALECLFN